MSVCAHAGQSNQQTDTCPYIAHDELFYWLSGESRLWYLRSLVFFGGFFFVRLKPSFLICRYDYCSIMRLDLKSSPFHGKPLSNITWLHCSSRLYELHILLPLHSSIRLQQQEWHLVSFEPLDGGFSIASFLFFTAYFSAVHAGQQL